MKYLLGSLLALALPLFLVWAQTDSSSFNIRVFGAEDLIAPTTPASLVATAVSTDQINLTWSMSSDNTAVSGYVVSRDGVSISTTTLTSYSDVGLAASTSYSYTVKAFDPALNYSSFSATATAMTFAPPPPQTSEPGEGGTAARVVLDQLQITPTETTSLFSIKTAHPARFEIRWGRTSSYELGYTVNDRFVDTYRTTLTDLEPGTAYAYEVVGYTPFGKATVLKQGQFTTLSQKDFLPPANVNRFRAIAVNSDVQLAWELPAVNDIAYVRIVRSHLHFPFYPQDGAIVYQGTGTTFNDAAILEQYSPVYYTAFVVDRAGNVSSGAIAKVYAGGSGVIVRPGEGEVSQPGKEAVDEPSSDGFIPGIPAPAGTKMPDLSDIYIIQQSITKTFADSDIKLDSKQPFTLSIPKGVISNNLKTIIVTLTDPTDSRRTSSFLLRINKDTTAYETVVAPLDLEGTSRIIIDIYDYEAAVVGTYQKTIMFKQTVSEAIPIFPDRLIAWLQYLGPLLLALLLLLIGYRQYHARKGAA